MRSLYTIKRTKKRFKHRYCYKVINSKSKRIFSKCSSKKNALIQQKLLYSLIYRKNRKID